MKTQDTNSSDIQTSPVQPTVQSSRKSWLSVAGALIVVVLIVGLSAVVFAQLNAHRSARSAQKPAPGNWVQVLKGYTITSFAAARSNPAVLFACALQSQSYTPLPGTSSNKTGTVNTAGATVLRSTDYGNTWQNIGDKEAFNGGCQLAVNPAESNEVYAMGAIDSTHTDALKHSINGGKTWETIQPALQDSAGVQPPLAWHVTHLSFEGKRLFALQWAPQRFIPETPQGSTAQFNLLPRLIASADGGHNWIAIDNEFRNMNQGVSDYAVDPSNPNDIYIITGRGGPPIVSPRQVSPPNQNVIPSYVSSLQLYKTTDGGATWHSLLSSLPFGSQVQIATGNSHIVYVGGSFGPLPYSSQQGGATYQNSDGYFQLRMSSDGGANWQQIALPQNAVNILNWFVSPDGQVYTSSMSFTEQPTVVKGTIVPVRREAMPLGPAKPVSIPPVGSSASTRDNASLNGTPVSSAVPSSFTEIASSSQFIQKYDPTTNKWSGLASSPTSGMIVAVTAIDENGGTALWLQGSNAGEQSLYRYVL